jgi:hypothetical protein
LLFPSGGIRGRCLQTEKRASAGLFHLTRIAVSSMVESQAKNVRPKGRHGAAPGGPLGGVPPASERSSAHDRYNHVMQGEYGESELSERP